jgi:hypothetical protein
MHYRKLPFRLRTFSCVPWKLVVLLQMLHPPVVTCHKKHLLLKCEERGYTLDEVMPCVIAQDGDDWTIDTTHVAYPMASRIPVMPGVGSELKRLLSRIGIESTPTCKCNARANFADVQGVDWCEANVPEIVGWLKEAAEDRGLPFMEAAGKWLVRRAIASAKAKGAPSGPNRMEAATGNSKPSPPTA